MNTENLTKLADHLKTVNPDNFDMARFSNAPPLYFKSDLELLKNPPLPEIACAAGHAISIFPLEKTDLSNDEDGFYCLDEEAFTVRVFDIDSDSQVWDFLFSGRWAVFDNSIEGAIQRIELLISYPKKAISSFKTGVLS